MNRVSYFIQRQEGGLNWVNILLLLILIGIALGAWIYGPGLYKNYQLGHFAKDQAIKASELSDTTIMYNIREEAEKMGIPPATFQVIVQRFASRMKIDYSFELPVTVPGMQGKMLKFSKQLDQKYGQIQHIEDDSSIDKYK